MGSSKIDRALKILIVDDHEVVREGLKMVLLDWRKAEVYMASNAKESQILLQQNSNIDLVILDLTLPDVRRFELLDSIVKTAPLSPVVIFSADERVSVISETFDRGAKGFLPKSSSQELINYALDRVMSGEVYLPPSISDINLNQNKVNSSNISIPNLTNRQLDILELLVHGDSNKEIAEKLHMSPATIRSYLTIIFRQLDVKNRTEAVHVARQNGIIKD